MEAGGGNSRAPNPLYETLNCIILYQIATIRGGYLKVYVVLCRTFKDDDRVCHLPIGL